MSNRLHHIAMILSIIGLLAFSGTTYAADLILQNSQTTVGVGDEFMISVLLSSKEEAINAISLDMLFSDNTISVARILSGSSIVSSWVDAPRASGNAVILSGIMPGGYTSVIDPVTHEELPGAVVKIVFHADHPGQATIRFTDAHIYRNDGTGTEVPLSIAPFSLAIAAEGSNTVIPQTDTFPPLAFTPLLGSDPSVAGGRPFVAFSTTDKESGVAYYEVDIGNGQWIRANSPYELPADTSGLDIRVKAVDAFGNYTIGSVKTSPQSLLVSVGIPIAIVCLVVLIVRIVSWYHIRHHRRKMLGDKGYTDVV